MPLEDGEVEGFVGAGGGWGGGHVGERVAGVGGEEVGELGRSWGVGVGGLVGLGDMRVLEMVWMGFCHCL